MKYLLHRLGLIFTTIIGVTFISFAMLRMVPGDPVLLLLGERGASTEVYNEMKASLGLDKPYFQQYLDFIKNAATGNFGISIISKRPVIEEFWSRFPATLELSVCSLFFAILIGIPFGILAAVKRNTPLDFSIMGASLIGYSMPIFWWGLLLIMVFSVHLGWTPVSGRIGVEFDFTTKSGFFLIDSFLTGEGWPAFWDTLKHLILPAIVMGTIPLAVISRMTRSSLLEVLKEDYIRTAKAKGVKPFQLIVVHALRNALIPIVTVIGLLIGSLVTGAILTETIFSWPGIGKWLVSSVTARDYPVIQAAVLLISLVIITINFIIDFIYVVINPTLRSEP